MYKTIIISLLTISMLAFTSCRKSLTGSDADFEGTWYGDYTELVIGSNGRGSYTYDDGMRSKNINGKVKIKDDKLKISFTVISKKYTINQRPTINNSSNNSYYSSGYTYMILDGEYFEKY